MNTRSLFSNLTKYATILFSIILCHTSVYADTNNTYVSLSGYTSLSTAINSIGSNEKTLLIDKNDTINANITIPANVSLKFTRPYKLTINNGAKLTVKSSITASPVQIFSGGGDVAFDNSTQKQIYPHWFYNNSGDWTNAIQAAIDSSGGVEITFPRQEYIVKGTITLKAFTTLKGVGTRKMSENQSLPSIHHLPTTTGTHLFDVEPVSIFYVNSMRISNLAMFGDDLTESKNGDCLHLNKAGYSTFSNLYISGFKNAINLIYGIDNRFVDIIVNYSKEAAFRISARVTETGGLDPTTTTTIEKCYLRTSGWGVVLGDAATLQTSFVDTIIEANTIGGVKIYRGNGAVTFRDCYTEANPVAAGVAGPIFRIGLDGTSDLPTQVNIIGGDFAGTNLTVQPDSAFLDIGDGVINVYGCIVKRVGKLLMTTADTERVNFVGIKSRQVNDYYGAVYDMSKIGGEKQGYYLGPVEMLGSRLTLYSAQRSSIGNAKWTASVQFNRTNSDLILESNGEEMLRFDANGQIGLGTNNPQATLHTTGSTILGASNASASNTSIGVSQVNIYLDEAGNKLKFKIRKSNGELKTATVPFD